MEKNEIENIIDQYGDMVYRLALIHTRHNKEDASDIFQDVFLTLIHKKKSFKDLEHCKAWLIRVTINLCKKNYFRRKDILLDYQEIQFLKEENDIYTMSNESMMLYESICNLPEKYKAVITLFYLEDMSCEEIAKSLGITEVSVRKRLSRGRQNLRKYMEGAYE